MASWNEFTAMAPFTGEVFNRRLQHVGIRDEIASSWRDSLTHVPVAESYLLEQLLAHAVGVPQHAQQNVLSTDLIVAEVVGFHLGLDRRIPGAACEAVEHRRLPIPSGRRSEPAAELLCTSSLDASDSANPANADECAS